MREMASKPGVGTARLDGLIAGSMGHGSGPALTPGAARGRCEGDLIGKSREEIRSLHSRRDRDWLQS
jgi:hypothetical protein